MRQTPSSIARRHAPSLQLAFSFALALAISLGAIGAARATEVGYHRQYGVGVMLGDPTGLSGKFWLSRTNAVDVGLGAYGFGPPGDCVRNGPAPAICGRGWNQSTISVNADYLWESMIVEGHLAQLDWHVGGGARALFVSGPCAGECWDLGVRGRSVSTSRSSGRRSWRCSSSSRLPSTSRRWPSFHSKGRSACAAISDAQTEP
jgi:hypothetical protein